MNGCLELKIEIAGLGRVGLVSIYLFSVKPRTSALTQRPTHFPDYRVHG